jgi:TolA-binding protein
MTLSDYDDGDAADPTDATDGGVDDEEQIDVGADGFQLPTVEVLTGRGAILGKSGSGKSNTASVVCEELLDVGFPLLIVDTDGEYYGLKEEYELLHVGADEECDIQVGPEHAERLASLALEENVPIILDVSAYLDDDEARELVYETARHLFAKEKKLKKPFLMAVEEVHEYIPQSGGLDDVGQMLIKIGKRGRKHGLGIVGISQRPADVKKDFITQANWLVWHRLTWENDTNVVGRILGKSYEDDVSELADGEAFVTADWMEQDVATVQFRRKRTFDAGATPGLEDFERPELKSVSSDLVGELEEISERQNQRQDEIERLRAEVEAKEEEIEDLEEEVERAKNIGEMAEQLTEAVTTAAGDGDVGGELSAKVDEIREQKNEQIRELESEKDALEGRVEELESTVEEQASEIKRLREERIRPEEWEEIREAGMRLGEALGLNGEVDEDVRRRLEAKTERIEELEAKLDRAREESAQGVLDEEFEEAIDFLQEDVVREAIEDAADDCDYASTHVWDAVTFLADQGESETADIVPVMDVGKRGVQGVLSTLVDHDVVLKDRGGNSTTYALNVEGVETLVANQRRQEELRELSDEIRPGGGS